ncbi:MAG: rod shape-determining protein MreD [Phycisphaerae bacterium]|nr:rod shape-determining protein MreD [Phycisphaerae bacterium]
MRWFPFILALLITMTGQVAFAPRLELGGAWPDALLILVVYFALHAVPGDALVAAWIVGILADLMTIERMGLMATSYALAAGAVLVVREGLFRESLAVQAVVVLGAGFLVRGIWLIYRAALYGWFDPAWRVLAVDGFWSAVYTALWSIPMLAVLWRMRDVFGVARRRYTWAGLEKLESADV